MDNDGIVSVNVEQADLQRRSVGRRADQHRQVVVNDDSARRGTHGMPDVGVGNAVLPCWFADPRLDNVPCPMWCGKTREVPSRPMVVCGVDVHRPGPTVARARRRYNRTKRDGTVGTADPYPDDQCDHEATEDERHRERPYCSTCTSGELTSIAIGVPGAGQAGVWGGRPAGRLPCWDGGDLADRPSQGKGEITPGSAATLTG